MSSNALFSSKVRWIVLQKVVEKRKLFEISYATTPKISAKNFTRSATAPFSTPVATTEGTGAMHWLYFFDLSFPHHIHNFVSSDGSEACERCNY
ncbi:hypothetical protein H6G17_08970 [Chroococcidiopsis sp. FACHB-1243]|uniref:hypothetical protein n=1 Tax=Chroococcidiopsis sp. [FACHB-1243] TaxID=2692781 RepID=UPI0017808174|nr:hypothetical protein [Chroococcidiopsis sp. [FACHB-1243]]MBD2305648.1 hypothetical protein [Chroococcidiopsis sp. [FACHB-1243]]